VLELKFGVVFLLKGPERLAGSFCAGSSRSWSRLAFGTNGRIPAAVTAFLQLSLILAIFCSYKSGKKKMATLRILGSFAQKVEIYTFSKNVP